MERVEEGSIKITGGKFSAFMYASDVFFHPKKEFQGLFQGYLLVRVSLTILPPSFIINAIILGLSSHIHWSQHCIGASKKAFNHLQGSKISAQSCNWPDNCLRMRSGIFLIHFNLNVLKKQN